MMARVTHTEMPERSEVLKVYSTEKGTQHSIDYLYEYEKDDILIFPYEEIEFPMEVEYWANEINTLDDFNDLTFVDVGAYIGDTVLYLI